MRHAMTRYAMPYGLFPMLAATAWSTARFDDAFGTFGLALAESDLFLAVVRVVGNKHVHRAAELVVPVRERFGL